MLAVFDKFTNGWDENTTFGHRNGPFLDILETVHVVIRSRKISDI